MYRCIIIDDEPHAIEGLKSYIDNFPELLLIKSYTDSVLALKEIKQNEAVDIIFMDVDMPKITGIELSKEIRSKADKLVFTTAHTKHAYEAFELAADAYLLKPYSLGKFAITLQNLFPKKPDFIKPEVTPTSLTQDFFFVKSKEDDLNILKVKFDSIIAVESQQNYVKIYTPTKNIVTYMSLTEIAKILCTLPLFMQLHRSFIINTAHIEAIDGHLIKMANGLKVSVGDKYHKEFNSFVNEHLIKAGKQA